MDPRKREAIGLTRRNATALLASGVGAWTMTERHSTPDEPTTISATIDYEEPLETMSDPTHCLVSADLLDTLSLDVGQQLRIAPNDGAFPSALCTVVGEVPDGDDGSVRLSDAARERLDCAGGDDIELLPYAPHQEYETRTEADENDEFVELLEPGEGGLIAIAPHGGYIEHRTDRQAMRLAESLSATGWACAGYNGGGGAYERWHVTSTEIDRRSFPLLDRIANRGYRHAVSFHGFGRDDVLVGGRAPPSLKRACREAIDAVVDCPVTIATDGPYAGRSPENLVNWIARDGLQIEQSAAVRDDRWRAVADAVADVYRDVSG